MTSDNLAALSDQVGPIPPTRPEQTAAALLHALAAARDADEAAMFRAMLTRDDDA